ncbi:hypothetical protein BZG36_01971 [Bifiguratus adelaidae]|uniref:Major facilitator superfamily (MFS) profile domain-containing protein n=1 Tax=Bifiguratus adelaidae TaxID=1938954 RepID=A0A261Y465_9FUNG|nr:hypothetical protein BZG36_01971 [Bifiguratus adelaidae]
MAASMTPNMCYNLSYFKELMREYRKVDDNIMLRMNTTDTHSEAACAAFFIQLAEAYHQREDVVNYCLKVMDEELDRKQKLIDQDPFNTQVKDKIYSEESKRRMVSNELTVEDIVRERSLQVFRTKCRIFNIPTDFEDFVSRRKLATRIEQEEASKYAMKGFAIGAAKWGAVGVIAASGLNIVNPWFRRTVELTEQLVVPDKFTFTLEDLDLNLSLAISSSGKHLRLLGGNGSVAVDQSGEDTSEGLNTQGKRGNIQQENVSYGTSEDTTLNSSANCNSLIGVHTFTRLATKDRLDSFDDLGHTGHTSDQNNVSDLTSGDTSILDGLLTGRDGALDETVDKLLILGTSQLHVDVLRASGVSGDNGDIKGTTSQIVDSDNLVTSLIQTVGESRGEREKALETPKAIHKSFMQQIREVVLGEQWYVTPEGDRVYGVPPKPPRTPLANPFRLMAMLTAKQWLFFLVGWAAWTMDGYDYFSVSLSVTALSAQFNVSTKEVTQSITLTLLFRSLGAVIFGIASDLYGRKWPLVVNLVIVSLLQLGTGFTNTYSAFLGLRSLFGIGMGGIWGLSASMSLENMPVEPRGLFSGILQQGYALGYLLAAIVNLFLVPAVPSTWRALFWFGSGLTMLVAIVRVFIPESPLYIAKKEAGQIKRGATTHAFMKEFRLMIMSEYVRIIYAVLLMTGFNFMSHGSQDLFPTYLQVTKGFSSRLSTIATIISNCGAIVGGTVCGYLSQSYGRRTLIVAMCVVGGALIPLWILPSNWAALTAGACLLQFCVQGAWGIIPIHLAELSPPAFRAAFPGVSYQLGNMISSSASQIEATFGAQVSTTTPAGQVVPDYGKVQGTLMGVIFAYVIILTLIGKARKGYAFETYGRAGEVDEHGNLVAEHVFEYGDAAAVTGHVGTELEPVYNEKGGAHFDGYQDPELGLEKGNNAAPVRSENASAHTGDAVTTAANHGPTTTN